jgi:hypothetical protein
MSRITAYCHMTENACSVNGELLLQKDQIAGDGWLKQIYKKLDLSYPKFYKMDLLSQTGFIMTEMIKNAIPDLAGSYLDDEIALLFANRTSSAETDLRFEKSYQSKGAPSPALFVYTLPNIVMGEIAIYNKWYGENMFAVLPKFAPDFFVSHTEILLSTGSKAVLNGWIEVKDGQTEAFVFMVESDKQIGNELTAAMLSGLAKLQ